MNISFKYYKHNPAIIQLALLLYLKYPLSLRQVEDLLFERGINITHETVRLGGIGLVPPLRPKSERNAHLILSNIQIGGGTLIKSSSKSEAKRIIFGAPSTMKVKSLTLLQQNDVTRKPR